MMGKNTCKAQRALFTMTGEPNRIRNKEQRDPTMNASVPALLMLHRTVLALSDPPFKGGYLDADPVAMWAGICFVAVVTVAYFFLNRRTGKR